MDDLISRQAAIKMMLEQLHYDDFDKAVVDYEIAIKKLKYLPSAQPLVLTCDGCRHSGTYDIDFPCSGCIRREKDYYEQE